VAIFPLYRCRQVAATIQSPIIPRELRMPKHNAPAQDRLSGFRIRRIGQLRVEGLRSQLRSVITRLMAFYWRGARVGD
jgi:hypothetical protein